MNTRPLIYPKGSPLASMQLNDQNQFILLDCITLAGCISPSGDVLMEGLFDLLDNRLEIVASGILSEYNDRLPYLLQLQEEFEGNV